MDKLDPNCFEGFFFFKRLFSSTYSTYIVHIVCSECEKKGDKITMLVARDLNFLKEFSST